MNPIIPPLTPSDVPVNNSTWEDDEFHRRDNDYHSNNSLVDSITNEDNTLINGPSDNPLSKIQTILYKLPENEHIDSPSNQSIDNDYKNSNQSISNILNQNT